MNNKIIVDDIIIKNNRISYKYTVSGEMSKFFNLNQEFFIEYSEDMSMVPKQVAVIPLLCNILPVAWISDAEIILEEVDKDFYDSVEEFKQGYIDMLPGIDFKGKLSPKKVIACDYVPTEKVAAFFSGGVDAFSTLFSHLDEKPTLVTLWGSDVFFDDVEGWNNVKNHIASVGKQFDLETVYIKSSFRMFLFENVLDKEVFGKVKDTWWHAFQHGIGLIGHVAPYAYKAKLKTVYIASSYTEKDRGKVTCASDPTIDNFVRYTGCKTIHDGYEYTRQDKIHNICKYVKENNNPVSLRVCWQSKGGTNCCHCEKCYRTIMGILAETEDPNKYGFEFDATKGKEIENFMKNKAIIAPILIPLWKDIQDTLRSNLSKVQYDKSILWVLDTDFDKINKRPIKILKKVYRKIKSLV